MPPSTSWAPPSASPKSTRQASLVKARCVIAQAPESTNADTPWVVYTVFATSTDRNLAVIELDATRLLSADAQNPVVYLTTYSVQKFWSDQDAQQFPDAARANAVYLMTTERDRLRCGETV